jgi:hypothetical protein
MRVERWQRVPPVLNAFASKLAESVRFELTDVTGYRPFWQPSTALRAMNVFQLAESVRFELTDVTGYRPFWQPSTALRAMNFFQLAESVRFELTDVFRRRRFSRPVHSTALPTLREP